MYCHDHPKCTEPVHYVIEKKTQEESMEEENTRLQNEIAALKMQANKLKREFDNLNDVENISKKWQCTKKAKKDAESKERITNVCKAEKFTPKVNLSGVNISINDSNVTAPIIIGGDYVQTSSDDNDEICSRKKVKGKINSSKKKSAETTIAKNALNVDDKTADTQMLKKKTR